MIGSRLRALTRAGSRAWLRTLAGELPSFSPAALLIAALVGLVIPLPAVLVDLLLAFNLATAVVLLVTVTRARRTAELLLFPSLVVVLTFVRLSLNVATTRLILAEGDAGRVIEAFAGLVIRQDLVIGAVMFAVITAIQYLVIARGAERVAEVAARFSLDGMPGHQQAIDADLRVGAIGLGEARARRAGVAARSDLYGRMDGVMRWVKGDAMVGLLITAINLIGGLAIGTSRRGLGVGESLEIYGRLAIGDGLLAQLPALLLALAAALLVARVDGDRERDLGPWLDPNTLLVPVALFGVLALVPGMPRLAFATTALGLLALALALRRWRGTADPSVAPVIRVRMGGSGPVRTRLEEALPGLRQRCEEALAIEMPPLVLDHREDPLLVAGELELRHLDRVLGRAQVHSSSPSPTDPELDALLLVGFQLLMRSAPWFVTLAQIDAELERCRARNPEAVRQALRVVEPIDVLALVRGFVRERLPAPRVEVLVGVLAERRVFCDPKERGRWPEYVREALAESWVRDLVAGVDAVGQTCWIRPTVDLEDAILARTVVGDAGPSVSWSPAQCQQLHGRIRALARERPTIVVCSGPARSAFATVLAGTRPHTVVLAIGELLAAGLAIPRAVTLDLE